MPDTSLSQLILGSTNILNLFQPLISAPISASYTSSWTPNTTDGLYRTMTLAGNVTINPPSNPSDGMKWKTRVICDGSARDLSFHANILIPDASTFTNPKTLTASKLYFIQLEYIGGYSKWGLQSLVGGY